MLYLTRKIGESIVINDEIEVTVVAIRGKSVKLGFTFPEGASVLRRELFERIHALLTQHDAPVDPELGKLAALSGVREYPARVKCASLCWHTLNAALERSAAVVSTE